jgi:hypothetical protein
MYNTIEVTPKSSWELFDGVLAAFFQVVHSLIEVTLDPRPANFDQENQDRQRNGTDDQDRLEADRPSFILMHAFEQRTQGSRLFHVTTFSRIRSQYRVRFDFDYIKGQEMSTVIIS